MAEGGIRRLKGLIGGRSAPATAVAMPGSEAKSRQMLGLLRDYEDAGVGWFWSSDRDGAITYMSGHVAAQLECSQDQLAGKLFHSLFVLDQENDDKSERTLPLIFSARKTFSDLPVRPAASEEEIWWSISGRPKFDSSGAFSGYFGNGHNITESRRAQRDASHLAQFDSLTDLANRHRMSKKLDATLNAYRSVGRSCAVMMIDLDRFKLVNDTLGHQAGDELLKQVAGRIKRIVTERGCEIGRLGGDEFQIMLPDIDDRGKLGEIAKTLIQMVSQPYQIEGDRCVIGASVGIAIAPFDGQGSEEIVRSADLALYAAKGGGRGQYRFYSSDLHSKAEDRRRIEEELRDALGHDQISLVYQPLIGTESNIVVGLEALMRWNHPDLGQVSPGVFIPIAEETTLISKLGEWALRKACDDAAKIPGHVRVAVNVSPAQFAVDTFPAIVASALANSGLHPDRLELELTENIFLAADSSVERMFDSLKRLGVRLALDDFGTGYSSLGYLKKAPFDKIKIDQSFIRGVTQPHSRDRAIITSIVSLAEALNLDTTAEGIETLDQLQAMRELKVRQIQGFVYEAGVPIEKVLESFESGEWKIDPSGPEYQRQERRTVFLRVGVIHEDHRYDVVMRNLSRSGAMIEGLLDVPAGTDFVVDFGEGQLAVAKVRRSYGDTQGLEFETPLVDDGAGGLCTRHRLSPHAMAQAGLLMNATMIGQQLGAAANLPKFGQTEAIKSRLAKFA